MLLLHNHLQNYHSCCRPHVILKISESSIDELDIWCQCLLLWDQKGQSLSKTAILRSSFFLFFWLTVFFCVGVIEDGNPCASSQNVWMILICSRSKIGGIIANVCVFSMQNICDTIFALLFKNIFDFSSDFTLLFINGAHS